MIATPPFEMIIPHAPWLEAVMPLLAQPGLLATGSMMRDSARQPTGLLVDALTLNPEVTGLDYPPLSDWIAVASPMDGARDIEFWVNRLRPRFGQLLCVLLIGVGAERTGWRGWTVERGTVRDLAGLRVIGPGMVQALALPAWPTLPEDPTRWSRVRGAVGERAFEKIRQSKIAIVGCSRTGTLAASALAALGVRAMVLADPDVVEMANLDGMLLSTPEDIGDNKAQVLGRRLVEFRPELLVQAASRPLNRFTAGQILGGVDLVITCVDQDAPRLCTAHWAREQLVPYLDIGTGVTRTADGGRLLAADVRVLLPGSGCVCCVGGLGDLDQAEYEWHAPRGALPRRPPEAWNAGGRLGSLLTLNSMAMSYGVQSWLDLLDGSLAGSVWHRLRWVAGRGAETATALVGAGAGCRLCRTGRLAET